MKFKAAGVLLFLLSVMSLSSLGAWGNKESGEAAGAAASLDGPTKVIMAGKSIFMVAHGVYLFPDAAQRVMTTGIDYQGQGQFLNMLDPHYPQKMRLPRTVSLEELASLGPDHLILKEQMAGRWGEGIKKLGIPVTYLDLETPEAYWKDIETLGALFGQPERAREVIDYGQGMVNRVAAAVEGLPVSERPRVLFLSYSEADGETLFSAPDSRWMQSRLISLAGGNPVWLQEDSPQGSGWIKVNAEQIALWNPDVVYLVSYRGDSPAVVESLKASPVWQPLLEKGLRLEAVPGDFYSWDQPDIRWLMGLSWFAASLHPQLFPDYDIYGEAQSFYQTLYGISPEVTEEKIFPLIKASFNGAGTL